ncbi:SDR family oxidoreductase [Cellulomonas sp.]|uniref:SDR family oxidoreductase n=1 Tax=Cellulomonas sp. TaxID=40001 RepID=UPI003BA9EC55
MNGPTTDGPTIAVVGATGTMGGLVLDELVARRTPVRALVRRPVGGLPPGVEQVHAPLGDEGKVRDALTGIRAVLYISPHDADEEVYAETFVRAAEGARARIVFAGVHVPTRTPRSWLQHQLTALFLPAYRGKLRIGRLIAASRTDPVIFSPTNFYQNDEIFFADIRGGQFPMPMRRVNRVDVRDLAELCARALVDPAYPAGEHAIAGPASVSGEECAALWSEALHRPVTYVGDDDALWPEIYRQRLTGRKLTDWVASAAFLGKQSVVVPKAAAATAHLLGREPRGYREYVLERARTSVAS